MTDRSPVAVPALVASSSGSLGDTQEKRNCNLAGDGKKKQKKEPSCSSVGDDKMKRRKLVGPLDSNTFFESTDRSSWWAPCMISQVSDLMESALSDARKLRVDLAFSGLGSEFSALVQCGIPFSGSICDANADTRSVCKASVRKHLEHCWRDLDSYAKESGYCEVAGRFVKASNPNGAEADEVDLLSMGCPCHPFSDYSRKGMDPRGHPLWPCIFGAHVPGTSRQAKEFAGPCAIDVIISKRAGAVLIENVPGMGSRRGDDEPSTPLQQLLELIFSKVRDEQNTAFYKCAHVFHADADGVEMSRPRTMYHTIMRTVCVCVVCAAITAIGPCPIDYRAGFAVCMRSPGCLVISSKHRSNLSRAYVCSILGSTCCFCQRSMAAKRDWRKSSASTTRFLVGCQIPSTQSGAGSPVSTRKLCRMSWRSCRRRANHEQPGCFAF